MGVTRCSLSTLAPLASSLLAASVVARPWSAEPMASSTTAPGRRADSASAIPAACAATLLTSDWGEPRNISTTASTQRRTDPPDTGDPTSGTRATCGDGYRGYQQQGQPRVVGDGARDA